MSLLHSPSAKSSMPLEGEGLIQNQQGQVAGGDFSELLFQSLGGNAENLSPETKNILEALLKFNAESGELALSSDQVLGLVDQMPKEKKLSFLKEFKKDLPEFLNSLADLEKLPKDIVQNFDLKSLSQKLDSLTSKVSSNENLQVSSEFKKLFGMNESSSQKFAALENFKGHDKLNLAKEMKSSELQNQNVLEMKEKVQAPKIFDGQELVQMKKAHANQAGHGKPQVQKVNEFAQFQGESLIKPKAMNSADSSSLQDILNSGKSDKVEIPMMMTSDGQSGGSESNLGQFTANQKMEMLNSGNKAVSGNETINMQSLLRGAENTNQVTAKVMQHLEQMNIANQNELNVTVADEALGKFDIQVSRQGRGAPIDLQIKTLSEEGAKFFTENEVEMLKTLNSKGIKVSNLKVSSVETAIASAAGLSDKSDLGSSSQQSQTGENGRNGKGQHQGHQSGQFDHRDGSDRRRQLWQAYQEANQRYAQTA